MPESEPHLAKITPVDAHDSNRVLSWSNLLLHSLLLIACQCGWVVLMLAGLLLLSIETMSATLVLLSAFAWLVMQFVLVFVYPEWPFNRLLCRRLRNSVQRRSNPLVSPDDDQVRVVELVPRERWRKLSLETASDLMLLSIDDCGVWMTGDREEYRLPCETILGAELHSITPPGWFTATHMVIVVVRTEAGQIELPISYRDHRIGTLASFKRRGAASQLVERIQKIATGHMYQPPSQPIAAAMSEAGPWSGNPYAAPAILDES